MIALLSVITEAERDNLSRLIPLIAKGDDYALTAIYNIAGGRLLSVAMGLLRDLPLAEDVLHDSFIKIATSAYTFRTGSNGYAWLCKIVRNTALNKIKSEKLRRGSDIDSFFNLTDGQDIAERSSDSIMIENALKNLLPKERTVIWLKYYNEMTVREIAAELSLAKSTVHDTVKTAESKLKKLLLNSDKNI